MSAAVGGQRTVNAYVALAEQHRPSEPEAMATEIRRLHRSGLTIRDISVALRLPVDDVANFLADNWVHSPAAIAIDRQLSAVERRIAELRAGLDLLERERAALCEQLRVAHD